MNGTFNAVASDYVLLGGDFNQYAIVASGTPNNRSSGHFARVMPLSQRRTRPKQQCAVLRYR
jgi:hypothetical protein